MLTHLDPASALAAGLLIFALVMVIMFEATNGFHDAANAVATVIYTKSLQPGQAVVLSALMNFTGVLVGGIGALYFLCRKTLHDPHLYEPASEKFIRGQDSRDDSRRCVPGHLSVEARRGIEGNYARR